MRLNTSGAILALIAATSLCVGAQAQPMSDTQIRRAIILESISAYPGPCPCPYNVARNGSMCGGRSAYSRPGGYEPVWYPDQITQQMIDNCRASLP
jgi:hypothetical protein